MFRTFQLLASFAEAARARLKFIKMTPAAVQRLQFLLGNRADSNAVRNQLKQAAVKISLTKRGCNGLSYSMNYVNKPEKFDEVVEEEGVKLIIDSKALMAVVGTELDYVVTDTSEEFVFKNPNEKGKCGCGESFHV